MPSDSRPRPKRRRQLLRRLALLLTGIGISNETIAVTGMVLGILAGISFMGTGEGLNTTLFWTLGMVFCLLRIICIRVDQFLHHSTRRTVEEAYFIELPERVSDAVTLIGFGFALDSSPWLGLAAALAAIFSAYIRSIGVMRGAANKSAASGPMTRIHRLILVSLTSGLMVSGIPNEHFTTPVPVIALWVILIGCLATILIRWLNIQEKSPKNLL